MLEQASGGLISTITSFVSCVLLICFVFYFTQISTLLLDNCHCDVKQPNHQWYNYNFTKLIINRVQR